MTTTLKSCWLSAVNPMEMFALLGERATSRKRRLFGCACVRGVFHLLHDKRSKEAVQLAESYADQKATNDSLLSMRNTLYEVGVAPGRRNSALWKASNAAAAAAYQCVLHHLDEAPNVGTISEN